MIPEEFRQESERIEDLRSGEKKILEILAFTISFLVLAPLIHEASHAAVVESIGCSYSFGLRAGISGLAGTVDPACAMSRVQQGVFYVAGYLSTLLASTFLGALSLREVEHSDYYAVIAAGGFTSVALTASVTGDLRQLALILGSGSFAYISVLVVIAVSVTGVSLLAYDSLRTGGKK